MPRVMVAIWTCAVISVLGVALGISLTEDGNNAWHSVHAWGGLAIAGAVLTAATAVGPMTGLTPPRAWQVSAAGAAALVLYWVLFVLPDVGSNTSLLTTVGVIAGSVAAWIAPGRDQPADPGRAPGHTW